MVTVAPDLGCACEPLSEYQKTKRVVDSYGERQGACKVYLSTCYEDEKTGWLTSTGDGEGLDSDCRAAGYRGGGGGRKSTVQLARASRSSIGTADTSASTAAAKTVR